MLTPEQIRGALVITLPYGECDAAPLSRRDYAVVNFRTCFPAAAADELELAVSAHDRYKLWLNGELVNVGPLKSNGVYTFADRFDLTGRLKDGENRIEVQVWAYPSTDVGAPIQSCLSMHAYGDDPCLYVRALLHTADGDTDLSTGIYPWEASQSSAFTFVGYHEAHFLGGFEVFDAAAEDAWYPAKTAAYVDYNPYGELYGFELLARPTPLMRFDPERVTTLQCDGKSVAIDGFTVAPHTSASLLLNAGCESTAFVRLFADGVGARIEMTYAESYIKRDAQGNVYKECRDDATGLLEGYSDVWQTAGEGSYEPFHFRTFRFIRIDIAAGDTPLTLRGMTLTHVHYPLEVKTSIRAEEPWLNAFWEVSLRTLRCCMHETYEDCPYYEQLQYVFDARLQILFTYAVSGDTRLAAQALYDYHESQLPDGMIFSRNPCDKRQIIPSFGLHYITMVADYVRETGNVAWLDTYLPTVDGILDYYAHNLKNGLVARMKLPYWDFIDWVPSWPGGCSPLAEKDVSVTHSLLYAYALQVAAKLHALRGHAARAEALNADAAAVCDRVNADYFDEERGMYREANVEGAEGLWTQHAQMFAVLTGAAGDRAAAVMERAMADTTVCGEKILRCTYPMQYFLCRALEETGLYRLTAGLFATWKAQLDLHISTIPETPTMPRSECHAWGALLLNEAPRAILGVKYDMVTRELILAPQPCGITMEGDVYTPFGTVEAAVTDKDGRFTALYSLPDGVEARFISPDGEETLVRGRYFFEKTL